MNTDSRLVYTSTTPTARGAFTGEVSRIGTEAAMGYVNPGHRSRRAAIYLSDKIHLDVVDDSSADLETMFGFDYLGMFPFALNGEASEMTCDVVAVVAQHTMVPYDTYHGIRVLQSDKPQYASKVVFYLSSGTNLRQVCDEVGEVVFGHGTPFTLNYHDSDKESSKERQDMLAYSCLDY